MKAKSQKSGSKKYDKDEWQNPQTVDHRYGTLGNEVVKLIVESSFKRDIAHSKPASWLCLEKIRKSNPNYKLFNPAEEQSTTLIAIHLFIKLQ